MSNTRCRGVAALGALVIAAVMATGCGTDASDTAQVVASATPVVHPSGPLSVQLGEWLVAPSAVRSHAGTVTFHVGNRGSVGHEMVVIRTDRDADGLGSGRRISEAGSAGEAGEMKPGAKKTVSLALKPGHYALICNLPGHYAAGMRADFTVSA